MKQPLQGGQLPPGLSTRVHKVAAAHASSQAGEWGPWDPWWRGGADLTRTLKTQNQACDKCLSSSHRSQTWRSPWGGGQWVDGTDSFCNGRLSTDQRGQPWPRSLSPLDPGLSASGSRRRQQCRPSLVPAAQDEDGTPRPRLPRAGWEGALPTPGPLRSVVHPQPGEQHSQEG